MPKFYVDLYGLFLKSLGLAGNAKIYLKDENRYIHGKLIFDDGKYAYVEFNNTDSNCSTNSNTYKIVKKRVSNENVSIFVSLKQQQDEKSEVKQQKAAKIGNKIIKNWHIGA